MQTNVKELFTVHQGDARQLSRLLGRLSSPDNPQITCTITSPPYGDLKNYGEPDQIGWGQPYVDYLVEMRRVFRTIYQHTRNNGSMWVVADTLRDGEDRSDDIPSAMFPLPFDLAAQAADSGWVLRDTIIWQKHKTLPWSNGNRLRNTFEYILHFAKTASYKYHVDRLRDPVELEEWWVRWPERYNPRGKVPTNVWQVPIPQQGAWGNSTVQHACPLPPDLVERLLFLSTDEDDIVLDPFAGTGVVIAEANRLGRRALGVELNRKYVRAYRTEVVPAVALRDSDDQLRERARRSESLRASIIKLRALKYPKTLFQRLTKSGSSVLPTVIIVDAYELDADTLSDQFHPIKLRVTLVVSTDDKGGTEDLQLAAKDAAVRAPLTKFGVAAEIAVVAAEDASHYLNQHPSWWVYEGGRTWSAEGQTSPGKVCALAEETPRGPRRNAYAYPRVIANVLVQEEPGRPVIG